MDAQTFLHFALRSAAPFPPSWTPYQSQTKLSSSFLIENILGLNRANCAPLLPTELMTPLTPLKTEGKESMRPLKRLRAVDECKSDHFSPSKSKRIRTIFTPDQLERLEQEFAKCQYVVGAEREELARILSLSSNQVKVWFQNRRIKFRKQQQEVCQTMLAKISDDEGV